MEAANATISKSRTPDRQRLIYLISAGGACGLILILANVLGGVFYRTMEADEYLVFHLVIEFSSIVVSFGIFTVGWFGYKQRPDARNLALAITFFTVGSIDFVHALSFKGMPDFLSTNSVSKSATYWIAARIVAGLGLLALPLVPEGRPPSWLRPRLLGLAAACLVAALVAVVSYTSIIPPMFIEGEGLTNLKNVMELMVMLLYVVAITVLWKRPVFSNRATTFLQTALVIGIFSELSFTLYENAYDTYNLLGHVFKAVSYYFILRAIFVSSLRQPYVELKHTREELERSLDSIGLALSSSLELNQTLDLIVRLTTDILRSPYALVGLLQRDPGTLTLLASHGLENLPATISLEDNLAARVWKDRAPVWIGGINESTQPYPSIMSGGSFHSALAAPILKDGAILGIIAIYSKEKNAFGASEASLLAAFSRQAAVAIENSRLYQSELEAKARIENYVTQLSVLHNIGLSLNRETNRNKMLKMVLRNAAQLTQAGVGIMSLFIEGRTEVISQYYATWYQHQCRVEDETDTFHQHLARLVTGGDALRMTDTKSLEMMPENHVPLRGLLIGSLRDIRGNAIGYFMLSDKAEGAVFSPEDEEVISLLAAQSSVALTSADSFEKERHIAETLQAALLPGVPDREDVEVGLLYRSSEQYGKVGGDFYDFIELDRSHIAVIVGDVCGKGLEAATYTAMVKYTLRAYLGEGLLPGDCLTRLNEALLGQLPAEKFITAGLAIIDTASELVTYSSAGHPRPCICQDGAASILNTPQAVPLGVLPGQKYLSSQISVAHVCSIFMYSDGLIEARPEGGEPFGEKRLTASLAGRCCEPSQKVITDVLDDAIEYAGSLRDDIAIVSVRLAKHPIRPVHHR